VPRTVKEWIGKTDDQDPSALCQLRVKTRANDCCQSCGIRVRFGGEVDHKIPIKFGGENRESNLQWLCGPCHRLKTGKEAKSRAKSNRVQSKHHGLKTPRRRPWVPTRPWVRHVEDD
jgi:5-methylcytosine-specific restriction protein A